MSSHNAKTLNSIIIEYGGLNALRMSRTWERDVQKIAKYNEHIIFNSKCLKNQLIPKSLRVKSIDNIYASHRSAKICSISFLKNRLHSCKSKLIYLNRKSLKNKNYLKSKIPENIFNMINERINKNSAFIKFKTRNRQQKKYSKLIDEFNKNHFDQFRNLSDNDSTNVHKIKDTIANDWVINLSNFKLTPLQVSVLKIDPKFQITPNYINSEQILANIESKLTMYITNKPDLETIRNSLVEIFKNNKYISKQNLSNDQLKALKSLRNNNDIIITNSDKGNKTVVLNKIDYIKKIEEILSDQNIYTVIKNDNTRSIASKLIDYLKYYKNLKYINFN